jgi:hypothetical protein
MNRVAVEKKPRRCRRAGHAQCSHERRTDAAGPGAKRCPFKVCPLCGVRWRTRRAFLCDPLNTLNGVQAALGGGAAADYAVYTHLKSGCGTSMLIPLCDAGACEGVPAADSCAPATFPAVGAGLPDLPMPLMMSGGPRSYGNAAR